MSPAASSWRKDIPDFRTLSDFRKIHLARLEALFVEVLKLCALAGLARSAPIAARMATGSRPTRRGISRMSYDRMKSEEIRLKEEIAKLLGRTPRPPIRPKTSRTWPPTVTAKTSCPTSWPVVQSGLAKIQQAKKLLEERARLRVRSDRGGNTARQRSRREIAPPKVAPAEAVPDPKDQINFTDPQSRISEGVEQGVGSVR